MTFQPGANLYTQGFGSRPESVEVPHYDKRAPSSTDVLYPIGKEWIWPNNAIYKLLGLTSSQGVTTATWIQMADADGPVESVVGTSNQVSVSTSLGIATVSLPSAITAPGSLTTTTSLSSTTTVTAGTGITATTGNIVATAGSVNAGTSMTATLGDITAINGNLILGTAGNKLFIATGANASVGTSTLVNGTVTVSTTAVTASSIIMLTRQSVGTTGANDLGILSVGTINAGTSFDINAWTVTDATALQAEDQSVVGWLIIN